MRQRNVLSFYLSLVRWSRTPAKERAKHLHKIADAIEERLEEFAVAESRDQGKPIWLARSVDIPRACLNFRFFATSIIHQLNMLVILKYGPQTVVQYTVGQQSLMKQLQQTTHTGHQSE